MPISWYATLWRVGTIYSATINIIQCLSIRELLLYLGNELVLSKKNNYKVEQEMQTNELQMQRDCAGSSVEDKSVTK